MAEPIRPASTTTFGKDNWVLLPLVADLNAIKVAEATAESALDVTRIVFRETGKPVQTTNRPTATPRLGDTILREFIGQSTVAGGDMLYAFSDQAAAASDGKKLYELIPEGTRKVLLNRRGISRATALATGQFYNAYEVEFGPSFPADAGSDETAESAMTVSFAIYGNIAINKAIVL